MIDEYNAGSKNIDAFFAELLSFTKALSDEEQRGIAEQLSEEELAVFDLLTRPMVTLSKDEERQIKELVRELLATLKREQLVLDWRKKQQARATVQVAIEHVLNALPAAYDNDLFQQKCEVVYQHIFENYSGAGQSIYQRAA
jgi:type I restriction enzyme R subunit